MSLRFVLSAVTFAAAKPVPPPAPGQPSLADVDVTLVSVDADAWSAKLALPAYDLATHNKLAEVRVYLVPNGHGRPVDGPGYAESSLAFQSADVSSVQGGAEFDVPLPTVDPGDYFGQVVLGFEVPEPAPAPSA